jgi:hypothetical protein
MSAKRTEEFILNPLSEKIDLKWAGRSKEGGKNFNSYYDYYFSGEDIRVYIDGLFDVDDELDLASFAYSVRQEKQPIYGFWSYNYDTVMMGTRVVVGEFTLYTRYPQRMTQLLEKAALNRVNADSFGGDNQGNSIISKLSSEYARTPTDEENIQKYWSYSQLDRITNDVYSDAIDSKNIFSAHPPFNFVIVYGAEQTALTPRDILNSQDLLVGDTIDRVIASDVNERNIKVDSLTNPMKVVIQQVNLTSCTNSYSVGGSPLVETYQFMARDFYFSDADVSFIKNLKITNASDNFDDLEPAPFTLDDNGNRVWQDVDVEPGSIIPPGTAI